MNKMHVLPVSVTHPDYPDRELGKATCSISPNSRENKRYLHQIQDNYAPDGPISDGVFNNNCSQVLLEGTYRR